MEKVLIVPDNHPGINYRIQNPEELNICKYKDKYYKTSIDFKDHDNRVLWSIGEELLDDRSINDSLEN